MPTGTPDEMLRNLSLPMLCGQFALIALPIACGLAWAVVQAVCEETADAGKKWREKRRSLGRPDQPLPIQELAQNVTSLRRGVRLLAAECLGESGNPAAVPVLLQAIERFERDAHFVEIAVKSLTQLGDIRALPTLRHLTHDRNLALMTAAKYAIASIEPKVVLLRASSAPAVSMRQELLRPISHSGKTEPKELLRVAATPQ